MTAGARLADYHPWTSGPDWRTALGAAALASAAWFVFPVWFAPLVPVAAIAAALTAIAFPYPTCLAFVTFSFFRLHEAFPVLAPLHVPLILGALMSITLTWHLLLARTVRPVWSPEVKAFAVFFALASLSVVFALSRSLAFAFWLNSFWKIGVAALALAWLPAKSPDLKLASFLFVGAGTLIATVAIHNAWSGVNLVELTRVSIGEELESILSDPNDLALVLLFPLGFAAAMVQTRLPIAFRLYALACLSLILYGIILTQSRGSIFGVIAIACVSGRRLVRSNVALVGVGVLGAFGLYSAMNITGRVSGGAGEVGMDESSLDRVHAWTTALKMVTARPLTGIGIDNFQDSYSTYSDYFNGVAHAVHSTWFGILAETGVPGFIAFIVMVALCFRSVARSLEAARRRELGPEFDAAALGLLAALAGFCASGTFLTQGLNWPIYLFVALATGIARAVDLSAVKSPVRCTQTIHPAPANARLGDMGT